MNIALIGYGKMGRAIDSIAQQRGHSIVFRSTSSSPLTPALLSELSPTSIDCCIDFSVPGAVRSTIETCSSAGVPLVVGTTGWHNDRQELIDVVKQRNGTLVYGSNFSVGAQMFFRIVRRAARLMNAFPRYDAAVHEVHHAQKKDLPSGTALTLGTILCSTLARKNAIRDPASSEPIAPHEIGITGSRIGTVAGTHSVLFHSEADEIELIHRAHNRSGFAEGAILAAELTQEFSGVFSFEELVFEKSLTHH